MTSLVGPDSDAFDAQRSDCSDTFPPQIITYESIMEGVIDSGFEDNLLRQSGATSGPTGARPRADSDPASRKEVESLMRAVQSEAYLQRMLWPEDSESVKTFYAQ